MKKVMILIILMIGTSAFTQRNRVNCNDRPEFTKEQMAELQTKKMTLLLDLNEEQQQKIKDLHLSIQKGNSMNKKDSKSELSDTELYEMKLNELNSKIEFNEKMRSILTQEQYDLWEDNRLRHANRNEHHRKRKG